MASKQAQRNRSLRSRRRQKKRRSTPRKPPGVSSVISLTGSSLFGPAVDITPVDPADIPAYQAYVGAHELLPPSFTPGAPSPEDVDQSLAELADPKATIEGLLCAILILGHTPSSVALEALRKHGASTRPCAALARVAADECTFWIGQAGKEATSTMLN